MWVYIIFNTIGAIFLYQLYRVLKKGKKEQIRDGYNMVRGLPVYNYYCYKGWVLKGSLVELYMLILET